ncbi:MAG: DUF222 domain-containing protein [Microbacteriaceae bacterium]
METLCDPLTGETVDADCLFADTAPDFPPFGELPRLIDDANPADAIDLAIARAADAARVASRAVAAQLTAVHDTVQLARQHPELFLGPGAAELRDAGRFVERSIVADLAIGLNVSEFTVWGMLADAGTMIARTPRVWAQFREGMVTHAAARVIAAEAALLPDDPALHDAFDEQVLSFAESLVPSKLRIRARLIAERLNPVSLAERFQQASEFRRVAMDPLADGMAAITMILAAADACRVMARLDATAASLRAGGDEKRTLEQLRVDVARDLLTGDGTEYAVTATVGILVPMQTLLDRDDLTPGLLDGYGPIDPESARRLTAQAPSFRRILTDPVSGIRLTMDRTTYRPTAEQRLWLSWRDGVCTFPGCNRRRCDIDHTIDWQYDGRTNDDNLALLCPGHHRLKHATRMTLTRESAPPGATPGALIYTDPRGNPRGSDPPPF